MVLISSPVSSAVLVQYCTVRVPGNARCPGNSRWLSYWQSKLGQNLADLISLVLYSSVWRYTVQLVMESLEYTGGEF